jgi:membrane protein
LSLISGLGFLLSLAVASLATVIEALGNRLLEFVPANVSLPPGILLGLLPATLVGFTFLLMYRFAPARPLPLGASVAGAVVAGLLWHGARQLFNWYLLTYAIYNPITGILGSAIALLLWLYYSALIFLLGGRSESIRRPRHDSLNQQHEGAPRAPPGADPLSAAPPSNPRWYGVADT